jgi:hypothetical protein
MDKCGATNGILTCDREQGHDGHHRGYREEQDEVEFWPTATTTSAELASDLLFAVDVTESDAVLIARFVEILDRARLQVERAHQQQIDKLNDHIGTQEGTIALLRERAENAETTLRIRLREFADGHCCHQCGNSLSVTPENDIRCAECDASAVERDALRGQLSTAQQEIAELKKLLSLPY